MSGLEIVGVILGAVPIIISAIDHYKTTSQRVKYFRYREPHIVELIRSLEEQRFFLESDLVETLQKSTDLEADEISAWLQNPNSELFEDPEITDAVREYLGEGYPQYTGAIDRCQRIIEEIAKDINGLTCAQINLPAIVKAHPMKTKGYEFAKRIKFSLKKDDLENRIKDLNYATVILRDVRNTCISRTELTLESTSPTITKFTAALNIVRDNAHRLYSAIACAYAGCHPEHATRLFLQSRSTLMRKSRSLRKDPGAFTMAFPHNEAAPSPDPKPDALSCYKIDIKILDEELETCDLKQARTRIVTITVPAASKTKHPPSDLKDICGSIKQARDARHLLDLYLSKRGCLCYHKRSGVPHTAAEHPHEIISLNQILQETSDQSRPHSLLTMKQRMVLSFNVASSIVQLNSTPWLHLPLTSRSIYFGRSDKLAARTAAGKAQKSDHMPQPFIVHNFTTGCAGSSKSICAKRSLIELGIVLLELWHIRTVESYASEAELKLDNSLGSRYEVARAWLDSSTDDILLFYFDLVTRCVECTFATNGPMPDWKDVAFRKSVCEYVLKPLWDNCAESRERQE